MTCTPCAMNPLPSPTPTSTPMSTASSRPRALPAVEAALARDPALAARVAAMREQNAALRDAFDPWLAEPLPERLVAAAAGPPAAPRGMPRWLPAGSRPRRRWSSARPRLVRPRRDARARGTPTTFARQAAFTHALYAARRQSSGRSLGAPRRRGSSRGSPSAWVSRCTRRTSTRSASRWSAAGWSPATKSRPRCSCTRTPTSSA